MVRIRLRRVGSKKQPSYRIVVAEQQRARDGKIIESVGFYNPRTRPTTVDVQEDRVLYWLSVGAQPSETVARLLEQTGTNARFARLRAGEDVTALVEEANAQKAAAAPVSPKTSYPAPAKKAEKAES